MNDKLGISDAVTRFDAFQDRKRQIHAEMQAEKAKAERLVAMQAELAQIEREQASMGKETFDQFAARQQCARKPIFLSNMGWLFENGARHPGGLDFGNDPPADPVERAKAQRVYVAHLLEAEEQAWHKYKAECVSQAALARRYSNCPAPPEDAPERLAKGKQRIEALRAEVEHYDQIIQNGPVSEAAQVNQTLDRERREQIEKTYNRLNAIQI